MACSCTAPRTLVVMAIKGFTFHPSQFKVFIVGHICCVWFQWWCASIYCGNMRILQIAL